MGMDMKHTIELSGPPMAGLCPVCDISLDGLRNAGLRGHVHALTRPPELERIMYALDVARRHGEMTAREYEALSRWLTIASDARNEIELLASTAIAPSPG
jgi:hypothetical protein